MKIYIKIIYTLIILCRLPLLADAILSKLSMGNSDRMSWEKVLSTLSNVVAECNEGARAAAQEAEMETLARYSYHYLIYSIFYVLHEISYIFSI